LGSYIQAATDSGDTRAKIFGMIAMGVVIVVVDRLVWWPLVVWSRKFKLDDFAGGGLEATTMQRWLSRSRAAQAFIESIRRFFHRLVPLPPPANAETVIALAPP